MGRINHILEGDQAGADPERLVQRYQRNGCHGFLKRNLGKYLLHFLQGRI